MDSTSTTPVRRRAGLPAILAAASLLAAGAAWQGFAAAPSMTAQTASQPASKATITRPIPGDRASYADIVDVVAPAVVTIRTEGRARMSPTEFDGPEGFDEDMLRRFFGDQFGRGQRTPRTFRQRGLGSGVIVTTDGYVLTNNHVVDNADDVRVELTDGREFKAKVVGTDKPSDLALLKVEASGLHALTLGDSENVKVGDVVLAVGNPLGIGQTVTMGIISAKGRSTQGGGDGSYEDFLQTDAPINHGNSGGALVNTKGELVGINSQILSSGGSEGNIGIGFAIPANMARHVMDALRKDGRVQRAQLGVVVQPVTSDLAESLGLKEAQGAIVSSVSENSAAAKAGVKRGDIIKSFNGQSVRDTNTLRNRVAEATPGSSASVVIVRDGAEKTLNVKLGEARIASAARDTDAAGTDDKAALGIGVAPLTPELAARAGLPRDASGVVVQDVNPDGRAADAGIQAGDVILEVNRQSVDSIEELRSAVRKSVDKPTLLLVHRSNGRGEGQDIFVTVKPS